MKIGSARGRIDAKKCIEINIFHVAIGETCSDRRRLRCVALVAMRRSARLGTSPESDGRRSAEIPARSEETRPGPKKCRPARCIGYDRFSADPRTPDTHGRETVDGQKKITALAYRKTLDDYFLSWGIGIQVKTNSWDECRGDSEMTADEIHKQWVDGERLNR